MCNCVCVCCACCGPPPSPTPALFRSYSITKQTEIKFVHQTHSFYAYRFLLAVVEKFQTAEQTVFFRIKALSTAGAHQSGCVYRAHACAHTTMLAHSKKHIKENKTPLKRLHSPNELCPIEEQIEYEKHLIASN